MSSKSGGRKKTLEENLIIADNRKANFQFEIEDMFEAGIVLTGSEIKSIRENRVNIRESYASAEKGEIFLLIATYPFIEIQTLITIIQKEIGNCF